VIAHDLLKGIKPMSELTDPAEIVRQRIFVRLRTHLGEWDLDVTQGLPWDRWLSMKPTPIAEIQDRILREIQNTPGVDRVTVSRVSKSAGIPDIDFRVRLVDDADLLHLLTVGVLPFSALRVSFDSAATVGL
jgi:hypothetical protein